MFQFVIKIAQFIMVIWPLIIPLVLFTMYHASGGFLAILRRLSDSLLLTWLFLFVMWCVAQMGGETIPFIIPEPVNSWLLFGPLIFLLLVKLIPLLFHNLKKHRRLQAVRSLHQLMSMPPDQFEELVTTTYQQLGYKARRVGHSGDHGVDVVLWTRDKKKWIVQCKRYRGSVGESIIRDLYGTMINERAARAILVTTAEITLPAEVWARGKPIELIDGNGLLRLITQARAHSERNTLLRWTLKVMGWFQPPPSKLSHIAPPLCPNCRIPMTLHPLRANGRPGRILFRCSNYPQCRVVVELKEADHTIPTRTISTPT